MVGMDLQQLHQYYSVQSIRFLEMSVVYRDSLRGLRMIAYGQAAAWLAREIYSTIMEGTGQSWKRLRKEVQAELHFCIWSGAYDASEAARATKLSEGYSRIVRAMEK